MLKNKILEKLLAIVLIFTLTFANFAFVTKSYASFVETLFGINSDTGVKDVEFNAYFGAEEDEISSVISDVNNEELAIGINLNIKGNGYLKNAELKITGEDEETKPNYSVNQNDEELNSFIRFFEDNTYYLNQLDKDSDAKFEIPISFKNEEYVNEEKISENSKVILSGIYVNDDGKEEEVYKEVLLNVSWKDEREVNVESEPTKYITFENGVILQTVAKVDNSSDENTLPVKSTELEIKVPEINGKKPTKVTVDANSIKATTEDAGTIKFDKDNWNYDELNNTLTVKMENEKKLVKVNENEDEFLQDGEKELVEEERYFNASGIDEYLITYTYEDTQVTEESIEVSTEVSATMTTFSGVDKEENINKVTSTKSYDYELTGTTGSIVSLNIENKTEDLSKAYTYVNYNNSERYEMEFESSELVNISYKDIVSKIILNDEESLYVDKEGNSTVNNDLYYKNISISKDSFNNILGEEGKVVIKDANGSEVQIIDNSAEVDENGMIVIGFIEKYSRLSFEISKPISDGNLVINRTLAMRNANIDEESFADLNNITTKSTMIAIYDYVDEPVGIGTYETNTKLTDTETEANLLLSYDNLSTIEENRDLEIKLELNNANEKSDIYGHSEFEIVFPESVENIELTNQAIVYGEGLNITSANVEGKTIRVILDGAQENINSGVLTNGTNIVLNANVKVNMFTPAKNDVVSLNYINSKATTYKDNGHKEVEIHFSAPTGLVAINGVKNDSEYIVSVKQGKKEGLLPVYSNSREIAEEIIVMNNNSNTVSDMSILGRIPSEDVKDIKTGEKLGTTLNVTMNSGIVSSEMNNTEFKVYYSENINATREFNDENNWVENPESLENMKSYLIIPVDENYIMEPTEMLKFSYTYVVPENLTHNEIVYGTFEVEYKNNIEGIDLGRESVIPDQVGLTTGIGPELTVNIEPSKDTVKENEEIPVVVKVENVGKNIARNVNVNFPIPAGATYSRYELDTEKGNVQENENDINLQLDNLEIGESVKLTVYIFANPLSEEDSLQEYIEPQVNVTADDLGATLTATSNKMNIEFSEFYILEESTAYRYIVKAGNQVNLRTTVLNSSTDRLNNVKVTKVIPKEFTFVSATEPYQYDELTKTVTWNIDSLDVFEEKQFETSVKVNEIRDNVGKVSTAVSSSVVADGTDTYTSNSTVITIGKPILTVSQTSNTIDTYLKEGENINYTFTIKNEGGIVAKDVVLTDTIPTGVVINNLLYKAGTVEMKQYGSFTNEVSVDTEIAPGEEWSLSLVGTASNLGGAEEQSVTNKAVVTAEGVEAISSNSITHIVEASEEVNENLESSHPVGTETSRTEVAKSYKISGTAWVDANEDGARNNNEELLQSTVVRLVNSETGVIQKSITTDSNGTYTFSGVLNGNYLVIFEYDTNQYKVTSYRQEGVPTNINSDAISTTIEQDGKTRQGAVTDVIKVENGSISNIDIGLALANTFDLKLEKAISNVTVQTAKGTTKQDYNNVPLAKAEIASKYLSGATVYVEYTITVSNIGDISGYAKKIVDYIPEGMTFNSNLEVNKDWYTGSDGNLYTNILENKELKSGDKIAVKLVLTKQMTEENTGIINNLAEIYEDYNTFGTKDLNSVPANKAQGENDMGSADVVMAVKTGEVFIYVSVIIVTMLLGAVVIFIAYNKIVVAKRKGGV